MTVKLLYKAIIYLTVSHRIALGTVETLITFCMNVTIHFFTHRSYDSHLCGKSTAIIIKILNF